jgi:hypothetical protein
LLAETIEWIAILSIQIAEEYRPTRSFPPEFVMTLSKSPQFSIAYRPSKQIHSPRDCWLMARKLNLSMILRQTSSSIDSSYLHVKYLVAYFMQNPMSYQSVVSFEHIQPSETQFAILLSPS